MWAGLHRTQASHPTEFQGLAHIFRPPGRGASLAMAPLPVAPFGSLKSLSGVLDEIPRIGFFWNRRSRKKNGKGSPTIAVLAASIRSGNRGQPGKPQGIAQRAEGIQRIFFTTTEDPDACERFARKLPHAGRVTNSSKTHTKAAGTKSNLKCPSRSWHYIFCPRTDHIQAQAKPFPSLSSDPSARPVPPSNRVRKNPDFRQKIWSLNIPSKESDRSNRTSDSE